jgi:hypothetical protein
MFHLKGAVSRVAEGATAFGNRQALHAITLDGVWRPGEGYGERDTAWTRAFFAALGRFREGVYINLLGGDEDRDRIREAYGDAVYARGLRSRAARRSYEAPAHLTRTAARSPDPRG